MFASRKTCPCGGACPRCQGVAQKHLVTPRQDSVSRPTAKHTGGKANDSGIFQSELVINDPWDRYEREADRIAEIVVRSPESTATDSSASAKLNSIAPTPASRLNFSAEPKRRAREITPQMENAANTVEAPPIVNEVLNSAGRPLDSAARAFMEPRLGHDFSAVRISTDSRAAASAKVLGALAYTSGTHIVFADGQYRPESKEGQLLLAHELVHTLQQGSAASVAHSSFESPARLLAHDPSPRRRAIFRKPAGTSPQKTESYSEEADEIQNSLRTVTDLLSTSITDWRVTESEALQALKILRSLRPEALLFVVEAMRLSGRWNTLLKKVPSSGFDDLLDLEKKIDPNIGYLLSGDKVRIEISGGSRAEPDYSFETEITHEGLILPGLTTPIKAAEMLPRDVPDLVAKQYIDEVARLRPFVRLRVASRGRAYSPKNGTVAGEIWFESTAIRDDSPAGKRRGKRQAFMAYVISVPTKDSFTLSALIRYTDWIDKNYENPEFLSREPSDLWSWALKENSSRVSSSSISKFLQVEYSIEALARNAPADEKRQLDEALGRYMSWLDAHLQDPKLGETNPLSVWSSAYRKTLDKWARAQEQQLLANIRREAQEREDKLNLEAAGKKLDEAIDFLQAHVWKIPDPEIAEDHTRGVGYLIMASDAEIQVRSQIGRRFLHEFIESTNKPGFYRTSAKNDFRSWLAEHPDLYNEFLLAQSTPYVEHYAVEIYRPAWQMAVETGISFIPIVGQIVGAGEAILGVDLFGNDLGPVERAVLGAFVLLPMVSKVFKVTRGVVTTASISKAYPMLTAQEVERVFWVSSRLRPGSLSEGIVRKAAKSVVDRKSLNDPEQIRNMEKVLQDIGFMDSASGRAFGAEERAASEASRAGTGQGGTNVAPLPTSTFPEDLERMIAEETAGLEHPGSKPITEIGGKPIDPKARPVPANSFHDALDRVEINAIPKEELAGLKRDWRAYRGPIQRENDYIRYRYLKTRDEFPEIIGYPRQLGAPGAIEQEAGHLFEKYIDYKLPPGNDIRRRFTVGLPTAVEPDHLPPGRKTTYLNPDGTASATETGISFSAEFVGESKYRDFVGADREAVNQSVGFVRLARFSDQKKLVYYMRWQPRFQTAHAVADAYNLGILVPDSIVPSLVHQEIRAEAANLGVTIEVVSNPEWR